MSQTAGEKITFSPSNKIQVPNHPIVPFIEGDGTGPDIWNASVRVFDAAVKKAYGGSRSIVWKEVFAGEKANRVKGEWLPQETIDSIKEYSIAIKGPLGTPVGGGLRSLNVALRKLLDLYACIRPIKYFRGVPSPIREPQKVDMVIFRENTEDVYAGYEWKSGSEESKKLIDFLNSQLACKIREGSGVGIKPMSPFGSKRLIRMAIQHALKMKRSSVTLVHKGNIMKFTEGAFREWGYNLAKEEFGDQTISEDDLWSKYNGKQPEGKLVIKDRIADNMFQQVLLRPEDYSVIATPNLNGDYLSDALSAQVGGLGISPGANIGDKAAVFEATHGTAPKYAGLDKINPTAVIMSGIMMFEYLQWQEAADLITNAIQRTIDSKNLTYDFARQVAGSKEVKTSEFGSLIISNM